MCKKKIKLHNNGFRQVGFCATDSRSCGIRLIDTHLTDTHLTDIRLIDTHLTDTHLTDIRLIDTHLTDTHLTDIRDMSVWARAVWNANLKPIFGSLMVVIRHRYRHDPITSYAPGLPAIGHAVYLSNNYIIITNARLGMRESFMKPLDLTLTISDDMPTFPGSPKPRFAGWSDLERDGYNLELLFASTHSGTHLDAPWHFTKDGFGVDRIPTDLLVGKALLVNLDEQMVSKDNYAITRDDIRAFEESDEGHTISAGMRIVFFTGWQKTHLAEENYFLANPGLDASAARYLVSRGVELVGIDSPSIDMGRDSSFSVHHILADAGIIIVENLANLEKIPAVEFVYAILPLKLKGASGSPVRALALDW